MKILTKNLWIVVLILCNISFGFTQNTVPNGWYQFRGQNRDGKSLEVFQNENWTESSPQLIWKKNIGSGFSELLISEGILYTMESEKTAKAAIRPEKHVLEIVKIVTLTTINAGPDRTSADRNAHADDFVPRPCRKTIFIQSMVNSPGHGRAANRQRTGNELGRIPSRETTNSLTSTSTNHFQHHD